jgi:hypothetical protein
MLFNMCSLIRIPSPSSIASYITNCLSHVTQPSRVLLAISALESWSTIFIGLKNNSTGQSTIHPTLRLGSVNLQVVVLKLCPNIIRIDSHSTESEVRNSKTLTQEKKRVLDGGKFAKALWFGQMRTGKNICIFAIWEIPEV